MKVYAAQHGVELVEVARRVVDDELSVDALAVRLTTTPAPSNAARALSDHRSTSRPDRPASDVDEVEMIESCSSTWELDREHRRFRRLLKGAALTGITTGWRPYHHLIRSLRSDDVLVFLDASATRMLRIHRHGDGRCLCPPATQHSRTA
jgi:hypothetical protein